MRVIAGSARRLLLKTPPGTDTRPTTDRIKETLFNILQQDLYGCRFLDLFAGSGGIGIEALSRGADYAVFVDNDSTAVRCIEENLAHTHLTEKGRIIKQDFVKAVSMLSAREAPFDIIFADPPYHAGFEAVLLNSLRSSGLLKGSTQIVLEADRMFTLPDPAELGFIIRREKEYKTNKHIFLAPLL